MGAILGDLGRAYNLRPSTPTETGLPQVA